jgi:hypothetical protein
MSKLFILEELHQGDWIPISFILGDYRYMINWLGDNYGSNSRLRRVGNREHYRALKFRLCKATIPVGATYKKIPWVTLVEFDLERTEWMK